MEEDKRAREEAAKHVVIGKTPQQAPAPIRQPITEEGFKKFNSIEETHGSYTDFFNQSREHIKGFEAQGEEKLRLERKDRDLAKVQTGELTENEFLDRHYTYDILEAQNMHVTSPTYWYNKMMSGDTSNPLHNDYIMDMARAEARSQLMKNDVDNIALNRDGFLEGTTAAKEYIGKRLSDEEFYQVFGSYLNFDEDSAADLLDGYTKLGYMAGEREMPIIKDEDGRATHYLHTNGVLYNVSDERASKGTWKAVYDDHNNIKYITQNNEVVSTARSVLGGVGSIVYSIAQLIGTATVGTAKAALTFDIQGFGDVYGATEQFKNKWLGSVTSAGTLHLSENRNALQNAESVGSIIGTLAGMKIVIGQGGMALAKKGTAIKGAHPTAGKVLEASGNTLSRTSQVYTGRWGGDASNHVLRGKLAGGMSKKARAAYIKKYGLEAYNKQIMANVSSKMLRETRTAISKNHRALVGTYFTKDFMDNLGYTLMRAEADEDYRAIVGTDAEVLGRAFLFAGINAGISAAFTGGIDDSPVGRTMFMRTNKSIDNMTKAQMQQVVSRYLAPSKTMVFGNFASDMIDNHMTMSINSTLKRDGKVTVDGVAKSLGNFDQALMATWMAGMTAKGSSRSGINIAGDITAGAGDEIIGRLKVEAGKATSQEQRTAYNRVIDTVEANRAAAIEGKELPFKLDDFEVSERGNELAASIAVIKTVERLTNEGKIGDTNIKEIIENQAQSVRFGIYRDMSEIANKYQRSIYEKKTEVNKGFLKSGFDALKGYVYGDWRVVGEKWVDKHMDSDGNVIDVERLFRPGNIFGEDLIEISDRLRNTNLRIDYSDAVDAVDPKILGDLPKEYLWHRINQSSDKSQDLLNGAGLFRDEDIVVFKHDDGEIYIGLSDENNVELAAISMKLGQISSLVKNLQTFEDATQTVNDIYDTYHSRGGNKVQSEDVASRQRGTQVVDMLKQLVNNETLTREQAISLLERYVADGGQSKTVTKKVNFSDVQDDSFFRETVATTNIKSAVNTIGSKSKDVLDGDKNAVNVVKNEISKLQDKDGNFLPEVEEAMKNNSMLRSYVDEIRKTAKAIEQQSPKELRQIISDNLVKFTEIKNTKETMDAIGRAFRQQLDIDVEGLMVIEKNNPGTVRIKFAESFIDGGFLTRAESNLLSQGISHQFKDFTAQKMAESSGGTINDLVRNNLSSELRNKEVWMKKATEKGYIEFNKNDPEFDRFITQMGYDSKGDLLRAPGVSNFEANPYGIKINLTADQKAKLKKAQGTMRIESFKKDIDFTNVSMASASKGTGFIFDDTKIDVYKLLPAIFNDVKFTGEDVEALANKETALKVALGGGSQLEKIINYIITSKEIEGKIDTEAHQGLLTMEVFRLLDSLDVKTFEAPTSEYRGTGISKIVAKGPWDIEKVGSNYKFTLNENKLDNIKERFKKGKLGSLDYRALVPLEIKEVEEELSHYANKSGKRLSKAIRVNNHLADLPKIVEGFQTAFGFNRFPSFKTLFEDEGNIDVGNPKGLSYDLDELKDVPLRNATVSEIREGLKGLDKNVYAKQLNLVLDKFEELTNLEMKTVSGKTLTDNAKKLISDGEYRRMILKENKKVEDFEKFKFEDKSSKGEVEDDSVIATMLDSKPTGRHQSISTLGFTALHRGIHLKNSLRGLTDNDIELAREFLNDGLTKFEDDNTFIKSVSPGIAALKMYTNDDGDLEIPISDAIRLSKKELDFIGNPKQITDLKHGLFEMPKEFEILREKLTSELVDFNGTSIKHDFSQSALGTRMAKIFAENNFKNKEVAKKATNFLFNRYLNSRIATNEDMLDNKIGKAMHKMIKQSLKEGLDVGNMATYDLNTKAGQQIFMKHVADTTDLIKGQMDMDTRFNGEEHNQVMDNIVKTAVDMVANNKGAFHWNEYKNAFILNDDGTIFTHSKSSRNDLAFFRMMAEGNVKDLRGKVLFLPEESTFQGINPPKFGVVKLDDDKIGRFKNRAIAKAIELRGITDLDSDTIYQAYADTYHRALTDSDNTQLTKNNLVEAGMDRDNAELLFDSTRGLERRFEASSEDNMGIRNLIYDTDEQTAFHKEQADLIGTGVSKDDIETFKTKDVKDNLSKKAPTFESTKLSKKDRQKFIKEVNEALDSGKYDELNKLINGVKSMKDFDEELFKKEMSDQIAYNTIKKAEADVVRYMTNKNASADKYPKGEAVDLVKPRTVLDVETIFGKVFEISYQREGDEIKSQYSVKHFTADERKIIEDLLSPKLNVRTEALNSLSGQDKWVGDYLNKQGWREGLAKAIKSTDDFDLRDIKDDSIAGFNIEDADFKWLRDLGIIGKNFGKDNLDLFKVMKDYGLRANEQDQRMNLDLVKKEMIKEGIEGLDETMSHSASEDVKTTRAAIKWLGAKANEDLTYDIRNLFPTRLDELSNSVKNIGISREDLKNSFDNFKEGYEPTKENNYSPRDSTIRNTVARMQARDAALEFRRNSIKMNREIEMNYNSTNKERMLLKTDNGNTFKSMVNYVASKLPDNNKDAVAGIIREVITKDVDGRNVLSALLDPKNYDVDAMDKIASRLNSFDKTLNLTGDDVSNDFRKSVQHGFDGLEFNKMAYKDINLTRDLHEYKSHMFINSVIKGVGSTQSKTTVGSTNLQQTKYANSDIYDISFKEIEKDLTNRLSALYSRDIQDLDDKSDFKETRNYGYTFKNTQLRELIDEYQRAVVENKITSLYQLADEDTNNLFKTAANKNIIKDGSIKAFEVGLSKDLIEELDIQEASDGNMYVLLRRDPSVLEGASMRALKVVEIPRKRRMSMNETTAKLVQGDLDGDRYSLLKSSSAPEVEFLKTISDVSNEMLKTFDTRMDETIKYINNFEDAVKSTGAKEASATLKLVGTEEFIKTHQKDIEDVNKSLPQNRKLMIEQLKEKDIYNIEVDGEKVNIFDKVTKIIDQEPGSNYYFKLLNANLFDGRNLKDSRVLLNKSKSLRGITTHLTTVVGSANKKLAAVRRETKTPLAELSYAPMSMSDSDRFIFELGIKKAQVNEDKSFFDKLGIEYDKDTDAADLVDKVQAKMNEENDAYRNDPKNNETFIKKLDEYLSSEAKHELQEQIETLFNSFEQYKHAFESTDYASNMVMQRYDDKIASHLLGVARDLYNLEGSTKIKSVTPPTVKSKTYKSLLIDFKSIGIGNQDRAFFSKEFLNENSPMRGIYTELDAKFGKANINKDISTVKEITTKDGTTNKLPKAYVAKEIVKENGRYFFKAAEIKDGEIRKSSGIKGLGGEAPAELAKVMKEYGADILQDVTIATKKSAQVNNLKLGGTKKITLPDGRVIEGIILEDVRTSVIDSEGAFSFNKKGKFTMNNTIPSAMEGLEGSYLLGNLIYSVDKNGNFVMDNTNFIKKVEELRHVKQTPILQEANAIDRVDLLRALKLSEMIGKINKEYYEENSHILNPKNIMAVRDWGTIEGHRHIQWLKNNVIKLMEEQKKGSNEFDKIVEYLYQGDELSYVNKLFSRSIEGNMEMMVKGVDDPDNKAVTAKSMKDVAQVPGETKASILEEPDYRPRAEIPATKLMNLLFGVNAYGLKNEAMKGNLPIQKSMAQQYNAAFNKARADILDKNPSLGTERITQSTDAKVGSEGRENYSFQREYDMKLAKAMPHIVDGYKNSDIEYPINRSGQDFSRMPGFSTDKATIGLYKMLEGMKDFSSDGAIERAFRPEDDGFLDNVNFANRYKGVQLDDGKITFKDNVFSTGGKYEDVVNEIQDKVWNPRTMEISKLEGIKKDFSNQEINEILDAKGDNLSAKITNYFKNLEIRLEGDTEEFQRIWANRLEPRNIIKDENGEILKPTFKANKDYFNEETTYNLANLNSAGFKNTPLGFTLNQLIPQAFSAGSKKVGNLDFDIARLYTQAQYGLENPDDFVKYTKAVTATSRANRDGGVDNFGRNLLDSLGFKDVESAREYIKEFQLLHTDLAETHQRVSRNLVAAAEEINKDLNEPFDSYLLIAPYSKKSEARSNTRFAIEDRFKYNTSKEELLNKHTVSNYSESVKLISAKLKKGFNSRAFSHLLKSNGIISNNEIKDSLEISTDEFRNLVRDVKHIEGTTLRESISEMIPGAKRKEALLILKNRENITPEDLVTIYTELSVEIDSSPRFKDMSTEDLRRVIETSTDKDTQTEAATIMDMKESRAAFIRDLAKDNKSVLDTLYAKMMSHGKQVLGDQAVLTDEFSREIAYNKGFNSLYKGSSEYLRKNLTFQADSEDMFKALVLEEAYKGNVYYGNKTVSDNLDKAVYTQTRHQALDTLRKAGKFSSGLIMMNLAKLPIRVFGFTAFDMAMITMVNPTAVLHMPRALRDLKSHYLSGGKNTSDYLKSYFGLKGHDSKQAVRRDVIVQEEENIRNKIVFGAPYDAVKNVSRFTLDVQADLARYALFLASSKNFESDNFKFYGPTYGFKEEMDKLEGFTDEEAKRLGYIDNDGNTIKVSAAHRKAYTTIEHLLGSPGNFPLLARKASGLMVFNTFPLAFVRATKGYTHGITKGVEAAIKEGDPRGLIGSLAVPGMGAFGITALYNLIIDLIGSGYDMDEEDVEAAKDSQRTIDPFATAIFGTPTFNHNSFNPVQVFNDMTVNPIKRGLEDDESDIPKALNAALRVASSNSISRTNPFIKIPLEVLTGHDLYGDNIYNTKDNYNMVENLARKTMGIPLGTGMSRALVDQYQLSKYKDNPTFENLMDGIERGIKNELGNTRAYNKGKNNYFRARGDITSYRSMLRELESPNHEVEDLFTGGIESGQEWQNDYDQDDAGVVYRTFNKVLNNEEHMTTFYNAILEFMDPNGKYKMSPDTIQGVINVLSLERRLNQLPDVEAYKGSLSDKELKQLQEGLEWEKNNLPKLSDVEVRNKSTNRFNRLPREYNRTPYARPVTTGTRSAYSSYRSPYRDLERQQWNRPEVRGPSDKMGIWDRR